MRRATSLLLFGMCLMIPAGGLAFAQSPADDRGGELPLGADGKPLNVDFETGTLADWEATGDAFAGQPIEGDTVHARRQDMHSGHAGKWWIGGYERGKLDPPQGTLLS